MSSFFKHKYRGLFKTGTLLALSFAAFMLFNSCFTGIESTKKINLSREDRKNATPTPEERLMAQIQSTPLKDWQQGKRFMVSDDKALLVLVPEQGLSPIPPDSLKGKIIEFSSVEPKMNPAGDIVLAVLFSDGKYIYAYNTGKEFDDALENVKSDQIPMLIDVDLVARVKNLLVGKKLWSRSNLWYDEHGNRIEGKKFVEVTITDIHPGNMVFPLLVEIRSEENEHAFIFMNFGNADNESRAFHNLFSLIDIRKSYNSIDKDTWSYISRGAVKEGMTKEEVKLSLGKPSDIRSGHDYSQTLDIWSYDNGRVLWFEDGRLVKIRQ